jgi:hypothetical protein
MMMMTDDDDMHLQFDTCFLRTGVCSRAATWMTVRETMSMDSSWIRYVGKPPMLLQTPSHTQKLYTDVCTQRSRYTERLLHPNAFHTEAFSQTLLHTHNLLHADAFTKRCFKVQLNYLDGYLSFLDHAKGFVTDSWCITSILGSQTKWGANLFNTH